MNRTDLKYLFLIMVIFFSACIETDIYLPAFPDIMKFFSVTESGVQRILTWNFIGLCVSGPFYGPLSDSFGRKGPLMTALGLFLGGSLLTILGGGFEQIIWGRVLQGLGAGGVFTIGTAIIFDAFQGGKGIRALNWCNLIVPFLLAAAPMVGGYLNYRFGFRSNFLVIGVSVLISFLLCLFLFDETHPRERRTPFQIGKILADFKCVLSNLSFWQLTFIICLLWGGYMALLSGIAVLYVMDLGVSKEAYPFYQATVLGGYLIASLTLNGAMTKWGKAQVKSAGAALIIIGAVALLTCAWIAPQYPLLLTLAMAPYVGGFIWIQTIYCGEVMELLPQMKGIVASILTSVRTLSIALIVGGVSHFYNATIFPLAILIGGVAVLVIPTLFLFERRQNLFLRGHTSNG